MGRHAAMAMRWPLTVVLHVIRSVCAAMTMRCVASHITAAKSISCIVCSITDDQCSCKERKLQQMITMDVCSAATQHGAACNKVCVWM